MTYMLRMARGRVVVVEEEGEKDVEGERKIPASKPFSKKNLTRTVMNVKMGSQDLRALQ